MVSAIPGEVEEGERRHHIMANHGDIQPALSTCDCDSAEMQTMSHIINSCPLTKFDGGLLRLHEADEAVVDWLTTYGS